MIKQGLMGAVTHGLYRTRKLFLACYNTLRAYQLVYKLRGTHQHHSTSFYQKTGDGIRVSRLEPAVGVTTERFRSRMLKDPIKQHSTDLILYL
jgi:hypothetical protein